MIEIERALSALNHLDAGCPREEWVRIGMAAKSAGLSFENFHSWSEHADNYENEKSCRDVWNSFKESGAITAATLFGIAIAKGWQDQNKIRPNMSNGNSSNNNYQKEKTTQKPNSRIENTYALGIWERCLPALPSHEYILGKQGKPDGLRYYPSTEPPLIINGTNVTDYLVVPCRSDDNLQTLQFIPPNGGSKLNLTGAKFNDSYFTFGAITDLIYIVESIGVAWSVNMATECCAVVCFGAGRMKTVAQVLRNKYPNARLVLVPDRGKEKQASEIAAAAHGQWVELPQDMEENNDANDYALKFGHDKLAHLLLNVKIPEMRYRLLSGTDLLNAPPMRWLVQGVIPAEGLAALYGESGSGKSFLILDMAFAIASGEAHWFGLRVTKAPVTYICLEGESGIGKRIKAWSSYCNKSVPNKLRFVTQPFNLLSDDVSELAKAVIAAGGADGLIILDTLNRAAPGADENSSVDMGNIITAAKKLQSIVGGVVLPVHHTGKDKTKGLRGHSSLYAALDGAIEVIKKTDTRREWYVAKSKDDVTGTSYPFKLEIVKVGLDDENKEVTSCTVILNENINNMTRHIPPPKAGNQKIIWEALGVVLRTSAHYGQAGAPIGRPCVRLEEAIEKIRGRLLCDPKRQTERTQTAITGLVTRGLLDHRDGWVWVV